MEFNITQFYMLIHPYATGDLEGLKVSHDFTEIGEGEARILTLKDSRILDNEGLFPVFPDQGVAYLPQFRG